MSATIVLVHGGFVDGTGWRGVYDDLRADGFDVRVVQNATKSLADDAATTRDVLDAVDGPVVLVGHSYGGAVITEAGTHDKVAALVYITAFAPDQGESVNSLLGTFPADGPQPPILPPVNGYLFLDRVEVPRLVRRRRLRRGGRVHGRLAGAVGPRRPRRHHQRGGVAGEAELVPPRHRGPDDPARRAGVDGRAHRRDRRADAGQPRDLRVAAEGRRRPDPHRRREGRGVRRRLSTTTWPELAEAMLRPLLVDHGLSRTGCRSG